jgi:hypothetical protein
MIALAAVGCAHSPPPAAQTPSRPTDDPADAMTAARYPSPPSPVAGYKNVPPHILNTEALDTPPPRLLAAASAKYAGRVTHADGLYKLCIATDGSVAWIATIEGVGDGNDAVVATLRRWRYRPQPVPVCSMIRLLFDIDGRPPKR